MLRLFYIVTLASLLLAGCSLVLTERVEGSYRVDETPRCSATLTPALVDGALAVVYGSLAFVIDEERPAIAIGASAGIGMLGSAAYGIHARGKCRRARAAHDRWLRDRFGTSVDDRKLAPVESEGGSRGPR